MNASPSAQQQLSTVRKHVEQATMQIDLMRAALRRVDRDFEQTGMISCDTVEFVRTVNRVVA